MAMSVHNAKHVNGCMWLHKLIHITALCSGTVLLSSRKCYHVLHRLIKNNLKTITIYSHTPANYSSELTYMAFINDKHCYNMDRKHKESTFSQTLHITNGNTLTPQTQTYIIKDLILQTYKT